MCSVSPEADPKPECALMVVGYAYCAASGCRSSLWGHRQLLQDCLDEPLPISWGLLLAG
jgi:hypothetical protein